MTTASCTALAVASHKNNNHLDIRSVTFHRAAYKLEDFPRDQRPQFAIVGRSNVGKSSLINAVLKRKALARVSRTPGKTQAVQYYLINGQFYLVDLPGYGYAKVPKGVRLSWGTLVRGYLERASALRLIFLLLDARRVPSADDMQMLEWSQSAGIGTRIVLTKCDKLSTSQLAASRLAIAQHIAIDPAAMVASSSVSKRGVDDLRREIVTNLGRF